MRKKIIAVLSLRIVDIKLFWSDGIKPLLDSILEIVPPVVSNNIFFIIYISIFICQSYYTLIIY